MSSPDIDPNPPARIDAAIAAAMERFKVLITAHTCKCGNEYMAQPWVKVCPACKEIAYTKHERRCWRLAYTATATGNGDIPTLDKCAPKDAPPPLLECTFENADPVKCAKNADAWKQLRAWTLDSGANLWLHGPPGTGKTYGASCCINAALDAGLTVAAIHGNRLGSSLREWNCTTEVRRWEHIQVLMLDDIDKQNWKGIVTRLASFLDVRYSAGRRLIVTANHDLNWMASELSRCFYGDRVQAQALLERFGRMQQIKFVGGSLR